MSAAEAVYGPSEAPGGACASRTPATGSQAVTQPPEAVLTPAAPARIPGEPLSAHETRILHHLARGLTSPAIATAMGTTTASINNHLKSIYLKLGAHTRTEAATVARRAGLIPGPCPTCGHNP